MSCYPTYISVSRFTAYFTFNNDYTGANKTQNVYCSRHQCCKGILQHRAIKFKFSVTWSCVSLPRSTTSSDRKFVWFAKFESQHIFSVSRLKTYFTFNNDYTGANKTQNVYCSRHQCCKGWENKSVCENDSLGSSAPPGEVIVRTVLRFAIVNDDHKLKSEMYISRGDTSRILDGILKQFHIGVLWMGTCEAHILWKWAISLWRVYLNNYWCCWQCWLTFLLFNKSIGFFIIVTFLLRNSS